MAEKLCNVQGSFKQLDNKPSDAKNFILTLMHSWHTCSTWYTPDFHSHHCHVSAKACILAPKKSVSSDCSQEVTTCFMSVSVANILPPGGAAQGAWRYGKPLGTKLLTGYSALDTLLSMMQVLAHGLSVTHIYIFVRGRNFLFFRVRIKCLVECSGDRNLNEGCIRPLNGHHVYLTFGILRITLCDGYTSGAGGLKWNFCIIFFWGGGVAVDHRWWLCVCRYIWNIG